MVKIGKLHLRKVEQSSEPGLSVVEAGLLWDLINSRYKCIEETQLYLSYAHDADLKMLIRTGLMEILELQANELEKQMNFYKVSMPSRPPKSIHSVGNDSAITDDFLARQIFDGCQKTIDYLARTSRSFIFNDGLRQMVFKFLQSEIEIFDKLCRLAKIRGWIEVQPTFKP